MAMMSNRDKPTYYDLRDSTGKVIDTVAKSRVNARSKELFVTHGKIVSELVGTGTPPAGAFYSFVVLEAGRYVTIMRPSLPEISHAYVGHCSARSSMNHSSVRLHLEDKHIGWVHPDGTVYGESVTTTPILYAPEKA